MAVFEWLKSILGDQTASSDQPMEFRVGEGMPEVKKTLSGPRIPLSTPSAQAREAIQRQIEGQRRTEELLAQRPFGQKILTFPQETMEEQRTKGALITQGLRQQAQAAAISELQPRATEKEIESEFLKRGLVYHPEAKKELAEAIETAAFGITGELKGAGKLGRKIGEGLLKKTPKKELVGIGEEITKLKPKIQLESQKAVPQLPVSEEAQKLFEQTDQLPQKSYQESLSYNIDRLSVTPQARQLVKSEIEKMAQSGEKVIGQKLSNQEVKKIAETTGRIVESSVSREQTAEKIAIELNLRRKIAFVAEQGKIDDEFIDLWKRDKQISADIARQLQARRIEAAPREFSSIDTLIDILSKQVKNADDLLNAAKNVDFKNQQQVTSFVRTFVKPKVSDWINLIRYNSMLSSPLTHIVNITSNLQGSGILAPLEKTLTGGLDALRVALNIGDKKRKYFAGEGLAYAKGYFGNVREATKRVADVMRGVRQIEYPDLRDIPFVSSGSAKGIEVSLRAPMRLLEAMDQFFMALTEGGVKGSFQYRIGKGVVVKNIERKAEQEAKYRLFRQGLHAENQGVVLNSIDDFTGALLRLRSGGNQITSTLANFTLPFVVTPTNILKQGIEYSPFGILTLIGAKNKTEQLSKIILGTSSALGVAHLLATNRLTWAEPTNQKQKDEFRAAGLQPYSIKIGNKWYSFSKLHPAIALNFSLISALDDAQKKNRLDEDTVKIILSTFAKHANFLADQSYVKNIGDFVSGVKGDIEGWSKLLANYPQQFIPFRALLGWITRIVDPVQRRADPKGEILDRTMQQIMTQIPVLSTKVPARTSLTGEPISIQFPVLNAISPVRTTEERGALGEAFRVKERKRVVELQLNKDMSIVKDDFLKMLTDESQEPDAIIQNIENYNDKVFEIIQKSINDRQLQFRSDEEYQKMMKKYQLDEKDLIRLIITKTQSLPQ